MPPPLISGLLTNPLGKSACTVGHGGISIAGVELVQPGIELQRRLGWDLLSGVFDHAAYRESGNVVIRTPPNALGNRDGMDPADNPLNVPGPSSQHCGQRQTVVWGDRLRDAFQLPKEGFRLAFALFHGRKCGTVAKVPHNNGAGRLSSATHRHVGVTPSVAQAGHLWLASRDRSSLFFTFGGR
jgi:hypothetical protein